MCLDVDYSDSLTLDSGVRRARKAHTCMECRRQIEPGETYHYWTTKDLEYDRGVETQKMCAHCWGTIDLGCALTGCPPAWYWTMLFDLGDDGGFVGDILGHDLVLSKAGRFAMLRAHVAGKRGWKRKDGTLYPVPAMRPSLATSAISHAEDGGART